MAARSTVDDGWASRELVTGEHTAVVTVNGIFRAIALVRGRAAATWMLARGEVELAPFAPLSARGRRALGAEARDVRRFLALPGGERRRDPAEPGAGPDAVP